MIIWIMQGLARFLQESWQDSCKEDLARSVFDHFGRSLKIFPVLHVHTKVHITSYIPYNHIIHIKFYEHVYSGQAVGESDSVSWSKV